jgi:nicotinamidase-related amidase
MPALNDDLHGMVPHTSPVVLLLLDLLNDFEFPDGEKLFANSQALYPRVAALKRRCRDLGIPTLYVNDNFGLWRSDVKALVIHCTQDPVRGRDLVPQILPDKEDYFVLKPKHSGFYGTTLDILLRYLGAETLIITGVAGNICVLFTANDAFMRDYRVYVPADCTAGNDAEDNLRALEQMRIVLHADLTPSTELDLEQLLRDSPPRPQRASRTEAAWSSLHED